MDTGAGDGLYHGRSTHPHRRILGKALAAHPWRGVPGSIEPHQAHPTGASPPPPCYSPGDMRILFITATRIGDAVLSTGLLAHLLQQHPQARVTIACGPAAAAVFERMPRRDRTLIVEKRRHDLHWPLLWSRVATTLWDLVVDLRGSALSYLIPTRRRAILRGGRRDGPKLAHLATALKLATPPLPTAWTAPEDRAKANTLLPSGILIGLGPTASWPGKAWPGDRFAALFQALRTGPLANATPVIFAGPGPAEAAMAAPLRHALPDAIDLTGRLTLPEASACLARCAIFIGNDSGLMHLAAAAGTPTLGLFGPTPATEYAPAGPHAAAAVAPGPPGAAPMSALTTEAALTLALTLLPPPTPSPNLLSA